MSKENPTTGEKWQKRDEEKDAVLKEKFQKLPDEKASKKAESETEEKFDAKDWERIEELAYFIFKHRMAGDDPKARGWQEKMAKEYGLDPKEFTKESVEAILKSAKIGQWTPEAEEYMRKWDWGKAIEIYKRKKDEWHGKKAGEEKTAAPPAATAEPVPATAATVAKPEETAPPAAEPASVPSETAPAGPETAPAGPPRAERPETDPVAEAKKKMEEAAKEYAKTYGQARARRKWFQKILDINVEKGKKNQDVIDARKKFLDAREIYIKEAVKDFGERSDKGIVDSKSMEDIKIFTDELLGRSLADLATAKNDRALQYNIDRGWIAKNVADPYMKLSRWISKRPWYVQVAVYGSLLGIGVAGAMTGVAGLSYGAFALGAGLKVARAGAAGEGMRGLTQSAAQWYRGWKGGSDQDTAAIIAEQSGIPIERRDSAGERLEHLEAFLLRENRKLDKRLVRREGGDKWRRRLGIFAGAIVGTGAIGYMIGGLGMGGKIKDAILGSHGSAPSGASPKGFGGGPPMIEGEIPKAGGTTLPSVEGEGKGGGVPPMVEKAGMDTDTPAAGAEAPKGSASSGVAPSELPVKDPDLGPDQEYGPGKTGAEQIGHGEFSGDTMQVKQDSNIWATTREIFMKHADQYGYDEEQARRSFGNFREQGYLRRMGIRGVGNFEDLTTDQKHKIWAEWKTATALDDYAKHGGEIPRVVHEGYSIMVDGKGKLFLGSEAPDIRVGNIPDNVPASGGGVAAADSYGRGGAAMHEPSGRGNMAAGADKDLIKPIGPGLDDDYSGGPSEEEMLKGATDAARVQDYLNSIEDKISGMKIDPDGKAIDLYNQIKQRTLITSDQPTVPSDDIFEQGKNWEVLQEIYRKLGKPLSPNERIIDWVYRGILDKKISPESIQLALPAVNE